MPEVARIGDAFSTGHGCTGVSQIAEGSETVFANGIAVSRLGDMSVSHTRPVGPDCVPHSVPISGSSGSVYVNGIGCARVTDSIDAGAIIAGSLNVYVGG